MKPKRRNQRKNVVPPNAFSFYIDLYCSREFSNDTTKFSSNVAEATKSWLSLNESEKQQIESKFQECKEKYRLQIFNQLKNAEPFMKIKNTSVRKSESSVDDFPANRNEDETEEFVSIIESEKCEAIENHDRLIRDNEEPLPIPTESSTYDFNEQNQNNIEETTTNNEQLTLIAPLPPSVKTGHQLFCMLTSADQTNNVSWSSLPQLEKKQYSRAVSLLKKDYIFKYKEYLESLTPKQLFDHYHKIIS